MSIADVITTPNKKAKAFFVGFVIGWFFIDFLIRVIKSILEATS